MTTEAQILANRANALKSTGPKTAVGKAVLAQNAIQHGLLARQHVIMGEDSRQFEQSRRLWVEEFQPVGHGETKLVERIAGLHWRLERAERLQNELFDFLLMEELHNSLVEFPDELTAQEQQELRSDPRTHPDLAVGQMLKRDYGRERALERLMMLERWIESSLYKSMKELRQLRQGRGDLGRERPGHTADDPGCQTKPIHRGEAACRVPVRASRSTGILPVIPIHGRDAHATKTPGGGTGGFATRPYEAGPAKQSQSADCGLSIAVGEVKTGEDPYETKPIGDVSSSTPAPGGDPSRGRLGHMVDDPACETKPIDRGQAAVGAGPRARPEPGADPGQPQGVAPTNAGDSAKQSQSAGSATGARALPRCVRRVAWHYHGVPRS